MPRQSDDAYARLKADIVLGRLAPGSEHTELELAEAYGLGRAAVRVALTRLGEIRLVAAVPRRGFVIAPVTAKSIRDLFETRLIVEPPVARLAAGRVDGAELRRIDQAVPVRATAAERLEFLNANHAFHLRIAEATGNARLAEIIEGLLDEMCRLINLGLFGAEDGSSEDPAGQRRQQHQHAALISALEEGDGEAAERIARAHIESSYLMAREQLLERSLQIDFQDLPGR
ncbi:MAG: GntR family transcriptional regulator [Pseudomonadota bacterium]